MYYLSHHATDKHVLQDHVVYVHRNWTSSPIVEDSDSLQDQISQLPQSLHGQFHGREIHSVHFIPSSNRQHLTEWIATGAEDGAVRISRLVSLEIFLP